MRRVLKDIDPSLRRGGMTLIEVMLAAVLLIIVVLTLSQGIGSLVRVSVSARKQLRASRLADTVMFRLRNMHYGYVIPVDSSRPRLGLLSGASWPASVQSFPDAGLATAWTTLVSTPVYPAQEVFQMVHREVQSAGFSHFTVQVTYMRRDLTTGGLVPFVDADSNGQDDNDPRLEWKNFNEVGGDTDFYDFFMHKDRRYYSEEPNTLVKLVQVTVHDPKGVAFARHAELVTLGELTGTNLSPVATSQRLSINEPPHASVFFKRDSPAQMAAQDLITDIAYPAGIVALNASLPIRFGGVAGPLSEVKVGIGDPASPMTLDTTLASDVGNFSLDAINLTGALQEGKNPLFAYSERNSVRSSIYRRSAIVDTIPPVLSDFLIPADGSTVRTRSPAMRVRVLDDTTSTSSVSGVCREVLVFKVDSVSSLHYPYDPTSGLYTRVFWDSGLPPILSTGSHTLLIQAGDRSHNKTSFGPIAFSVDILPGPAPEIKDVAPTGTVSDNPPVISCRLEDSQSGINESSIKLWLDGSVRVSSSTTKLGAFYDPFTSILTYRSTETLSSGNHTVSVYVEHWHSINRDATRNWTFDVP